MSQWFEWRLAPRARFAVIGDPISHSLSPDMHNAYLDSIGIESQYVAIRVPESEFNQAIEALVSKGYQGLNVTIPNKLAAFHWAQERDQISQAIGASNTLDLSAKGAVNTDVPGFIQALKSIGTDAPTRALVLGAGGASRAVLYALQSLGSELLIWNRTRNRAAELVCDLQLEATLLDSPRVDGVDLIVNCTSGVADSLLPIPWSEVEANCVAFDLMPTRTTAFLDQASQHCSITSSGLIMLAVQGALSMEHWLGKPVDQRIYIETLKGIVA